MSNGIGRPVEILLVEDNPGDVRLTEEALKEGKVLNNIHLAVDGVEAVSFLQKEGKYSDAVRPDLILLDLNLPKKDGREVLKEIKSQDGLKTIPVVMLTTSNAEADIEECYRLGCNAFFSKPMGLDDFFSSILSFVKFWFQTAKLPKK